MPGHQSVLVRLPKTGAVLLTIDAVPQQRSFTPEREAGPLDMDEEMLRASTRKLLDWPKVSRCPWSSLDMMASNGRRSRKHQTGMTSGFLLSTQACLAQLLQPVIHHSFEISRVGYSVCLGQGRSQFLVEADDDESSLEHSTLLHWTTGRL